MGAEIAEVPLSVPCPEQKSPTVFPVAVAFNLQMIRNWSHTHPLRWNECSRITSWQCNLHNLHNSLRILGKVPIFFQSGQWDKWYSFEQNATSSPEETVLHVTNTGCNRKQCLLISLTTNRMPSESLVQRVNVFCVLFTYFCIPSKGAQLLNISDLRNCWNAVKGPSS